MPRFAAWMYSVARPHLGHRVLDAGAGLGTYTELMLENGRELVSLEYSAPFVEMLRERFDSRGVDVRQADLGDRTGLPPFDEVDSVLCLNVLEHVEDDVQALRNIRERVVPGGVLVLLVPAYPWLFNTMDRAVGHFRRYREGELRERLGQTGWDVQHLFRFNSFGVPGWWVGGVLRRETPGRDLTRLYDWLVPFFALTEKHLIRGLWGLSLVAVCRRAD